jgi:hypothetical protein
MNPKYQSGSYLVAVQVNSRWRVKKNCKQNREEALLLMGQLGKTQNAAVLFVGPEKTEVVDTLGPSSSDDTVVSKKWKTKEFGGKKG